MRKICVVITARPSYSRIKSLLVSLKNDPNVLLQIIVSASALLDKFGSAVDVMESDGFEVNDKIYSVLQGDSVMISPKITGISIIELSNSFLRLNPDIIVTIADRYETIATSIAASFMNIPLAHIQGGEVTGNIDEKVRHANTKLADYHFVSCNDAYERVLKLGENPHFVFNTGCPSIDLAVGIDKLSFDPYERYGGVGSKPNLKNGYIVVLQHPVTYEHQDAGQQIEQTLGAIINLEIPTLWFWPNIDTGSDKISSILRKRRENENIQHIHFFKNFNPTDFLELLTESKCLVGNSSVGIRECSFLGVPVVNIGTRQNKRMRGQNVIDCDYSSSEIKNCISKWLSNEKPKQEIIYGDGYSGQRIAEILKNVTLTSNKTINY
jgi:UDP-hydrolysing UDP-N-acetyl-D-glucosamine 2-epimerase